MRGSKLLVVLLLGGSLSGCGYNRIQSLDERAEQAKSNIGVQLTARNQLIPNMVATVQGAAEFERGTFTGVAQARAGLQQAGTQVEQAVQSGDVEQISAADAQLTGQFRNFINIAVEAYPQLSATQNFRALQDQLAESENRIAVARQDYNQTVQEYNTYVRSFPQAVTARVIGAERKQPYQAPAGSEQAPTVSFPG
ncbi:MAG: LemA family protein [Gemmatimonadota bacterium]|nr:LemA family protein [Gemmatimonadota bacterium]